MCVLELVKYMQGTASFERAIMSLGRKHTHTTHTHSSASIGLSQEQWGFGCIKGCHGEVVVAGWILRCRMDQYHAGRVQEGH
jgi:hypothetical protein